MGATVMDRPGGLELEVTPGADLSAWLGTEGPRVIDGRETETVDPRTQAEVDLLAAWVRICLQPRQRPVPDYRTFLRSQGLSEGRIGQAMEAAGGLLAGAVRRGVLRPYEAEEDWLRLLSEELMAGGRVALARTGRALRRLAGELLAKGQVVVRHAGREVRRLGGELMAKGQVVVRRAGEGLRRLAWELGPLAAEAWLRGRAGSRAIATNLRGGLAGAADRARRSYGQRSRLAVAALSRSTMPTLRNAAISTLPLPRLVPLRRPFSVEDRLQRLSPDDPEALLWRAQMSRDPRQAMLYLTRALRRTPHELAGRRELLRREVIRLHYDGVEELTPARVAGLRRAWRQAAGRGALTRSGKSLVGAAVFLALVTLFGQRAATAVTDFVGTIPDRLQPVYLEVLGAIYGPEQDEIAAGRGGAEEAPGEAGLEDESPGGR